MDSVYDLFDAVSIWLLSGICSIILYRLSEYLFHKYSHIKFINISQDSLIPKLVTGALVYVPIIITVKIGWTDPYYLIAAYTVACGFMLGHSPEKMYLKGGIYFLLVSFGTGILHNSDIELENEFIILSAAMALGYVVGDITKTSDWLKIKKS